jgi:hypothetical protein
MPKLPPQKTTNVPADSNHRKKRTTRERTTPAPKVHVTDRKGGTTAPSRFPHAYFPFDHKEPTGNQHQGHNSRDIDNASENRARADLVRLTVYRLVQEGLTNALKHAPGCRTIARIRRSDGDELVVDVTTEARSHDVPAPEGPFPEPSGRGLTGLGQRISLADSRLVAHRREDDAFVLRAHLPPDGVEPRSQSAPWRLERQAGSGTSWLRVRCR